MSLLNIFRNGQAARPQRAPTAVPINRVWQYRCFGHPRSKSIIIKTSTSTITLARTKTGMSSHFLNTSPMNPLGPKWYGVKGVRKLALRIKMIRWIRCRLNIHLFVNSFGHSLWLRLRVGLFPCRNRLCRVWLCQLRWSIDTDCGLIRAFRYIRYLALCP